MFLLRLLYLLNSITFFLFMRWMRWLGTHRYRQNPNLFMLIGLAPSAADALLDLGKGLAVISGPKGQLSISFKEGSDVKPEDYIASVKHRADFINRHGGPFKFSDVVSPEDDETNNREARRILRGLSPVPPSMASFDADGRVDPASVMETAHELSALFGMTLDPSDLEELMNHDYLKAVRLELGADNMPPTEVQLPEAGPESVGDGPYEPQPEHVVTPGVTAVGPDDDSDDDSSEELVPA